MPISKDGVQCVGEARRRQWRENGVRRPEQERRQREGVELTAGSVRRPNLGVARGLGRLWRRVGGDRSSGTVVRSEIASYGERPSSGPRAIAGVVEVLLMLAVSRRRIGAAAGGESRTASGVAARL